jgi:hypothetical protein
MLPVKEPAGHSNANLGRFNHLNLLLYSKKKARWAPNAHLTCNVVRPKGFEPLTF